MGTVWVKELIGGLDTRRLPETTPGGVLIVGSDGHITRGGEFESRGAFMPAFTLPAGTHGLAADRDGLVVFGSAAAPTMPTGVRYQRLQHEDGTTALSKVLSATLYAGTVYSSAEFADGARWHFYGAERVDYAFDGRARASFTVTGGVNTQATAATGSFEVTGGTSGSGNTIRDVLVDGQSLMSTPVVHTGSNASTATKIAEEINATMAALSYLDEEQGTTAGTTLDGAKAVVVSGNYAIVACAGRGSLAVVDISDPTALTFVTEFRGPTPGTSLAGACGVVKSSDRLFVACADSVAVVDISDPTEPTWVTSVSGPTPGTSLAGAAGLAVRGNYLYVACATRASLAVLNIQTPAAPEWVTELQGPTPGTSLAGASAVAIYGGYAYVACTTRASLAVISLALPMAPVWSTEVQGTTPGTTMAGARAVAITGGYAYVACSTAAAIAVVDVTTPASASFVDVLEGPTPGTSLDGAAGLVVSGRVLYALAATNAAVAVIDVRDPAAPAWLASTRGPTPGTSLDGAFGLALSGDTLYVAASARDALVTVDGASGYTAAASGQVVTITAGQTGTSGNGQLIEAPTTGNAATGSIKHFSGGAAAKRSRLTALTVNGTAVIGAAVDWTESNVRTAELVTAAINALTGTSHILATNEDATVTLYHEDVGSARNGWPVVSTVENDLVLTPASGLLLSSGLDPADLYPGAFVRTIGTKVYSVSETLLSFSAVSQPTQWTTDATGAGFIDMSAEIAGATDLYAVAKYQSNVAIFAASTVLIFYVDPDPTLNKQVQVLENTGTTSPKAVVQFGDNDVFYLDESGCRSLRARDASNAATTTDIGVPVDSLIVAKLAGQTTDERRKNIGLINPADGRLWIVMGDTIFVFSYFANAKVSAWTTYETTYVVDGETVAFTVDDAVVFDRKIYLRSGDEIFVYSGADAYDETVAKAWLPYFDAGSPAKMKKWLGIDAAVKGQWDVYAAWQPTDLDVQEKIGVVFKTTFNDYRIPAEHTATHMSVRFESVGQGPHVISSAALHHDDGGDAG